MTRLFRCVCCLLFLAASALAVGPATVTVSDVLYRADGSTAAATITITWPGFNTADAKTVAAGSIAVKVPSTGVFSVALVPNAGSTPSTYYKAVVVLDDGSSATEYWTVPASGPVTIAAVRVSAPAPVLPIASVTLGGTGAQSFTPGNCVQANADGSRLVSASGPCGTSAKPRRFYPAETCNGVNVAFTFGSAPAAADQFHLYWNGLALDLTDDYSLAGAIATLVRPCKTGDKLYAIF